MHPSAAPAPPGAAQYTAQTPLPLRLPPCSEVPAIAAVLAALAAFNAQLQPLRDAWAKFKQWEEALIEE